MLADQRFGNEDRRQLGKQLLNRGGNPLVWPMMAMIAVVTLQFLILRMCRHNGPPGVSSMTAFCLADLAFPSKPSAPG
ncbi:hypothetical protein [Agrobacterium burrii]